MKFGLHHSSWLESPDPAEAYEAVKAKAQWAEEHGFVWFSVMDHMIQILRVGTPDEPVLEGWTVLAVLAAVTSRHPVHRGRLSQSRASREDRGERRSDQARTTDARHRSRLLRGRIPAIRLGVPAAAGDPLADACNLVGGDIAEVRNKLAMLRGHCDAAGRDYDTIEKTHVQRWLLARDAAAVAAKRERLAARGALPGFVGTVSEAIDLIGQYQDAGVDLLIHSDRRNDVETREFFVSDVMPHFA